MIVVHEGKNDLIRRCGNGLGGESSATLAIKRNIECKIIVKQSRAWLCRVLAAIYAAIAPSHIRPFVSLTALFRFSVTHDPQSTVVIMRTISLSLTLLLLPVVPAGADNPAAAAKIHKVFDIVRGTDKIGTDTIDIEHQKDTTMVKIKTDLSVKVMFIEAYRYEHSCDETWKNGQLISFRSRTNDNGTKHAVDVTAAPDKLSMDADGKHSDLPKTAAPESLWGKDAIRQFDAFEPDTGKRLSIKVTDLGDEDLTLHGVVHKTHHYKIADTLGADFTRDLWFDGDALVRTKIIGSDNSVILSDLR